jgi:S-adenosylmethionine decarboxylase
VRGKKHYIDHRINSIQDFLSRPILKRYECYDVNVYQEKLFHTKMHLRQFDLDTYLFETTKQDFSSAERARMESLLKREIAELFHGRSLD